MIRMNINIAIVSMVKHSKKSTNITAGQQCPTDNSSLKTSFISGQKSLSNIEDVNIIKKFLCNVVKSSNNCYLYNNRS